MFGYLKIYKYELKLKEILNYKLHYCALCTDIGKKTNLNFRLYTSFDVTVFLHLFDLVNDDKIEFKIHCPLQPFKKRKVNISEEALRYSTFINLYSMYVKLIDDVKDNKVTSIIYKHKLKKFKKNKKIKNLFMQYNKIIENIDPILQKFNLLEEKAQTGDFDNLSNLMGDLYGTIFYEFCSDKDMNELFYRIGFIFGKWTYISDALDDYVKDKKYKKINPIYFLYTYDEDMKWLEDIYNMLLYLQNELKKCFLKLPEGYNKNILLNISDFGMKYVIDNIIERNFKENKNG